MIPQPASRKRAAALRAFIGLGPWVEGSLCQTHRGNQLRWQLTDRPAGKTRTLYVPADRVEEVRTWTINWKKAKHMLRELSEIARDELSGGAGRAAVTPHPPPTAKISRRN